MSTDFSVIINVRQHFGNEEGYLPGAFAGNEETYAFNCPNINRNEWAVLMFQTRDVDNEKNVFEVNGNTIYGGIPKSPSKAEWNGNIALINPGWLKETDNKLHIQSLTSAGKKSGDIDDFIIDNVVLLYKTIAR